MTDLRGKNALVTGANTGIGRVTAVDLARRGARVILACRSEEKTRPVLEEIRSAGGSATFEALDLADLSSVRAAASHILATLGDEPLPLLVNNAGLAAARGTTKDGFEIAFGTNHLGPYLLTRLLLPAVQRAGEARIVNVASTAHYGARGIDWDAVRAPTRSTTGVTEYGVSKLANVLFSRELARRVPAGVHTYALHPGVVATDVWRRVPWGLRQLMKLFMLSEADGAKTTIHCATSDAVAGQTGLYYDACREKRASAVALDDTLARELWERSAGWVGLPA